MIQTILNPAKSSDKWHVEKSISHYQISTPFTNQSHQQAYEYVATLWKISQAKKVGPQVAPKCHQRIRRLDIIQISGIEFQRVGSATEKDPILDLNLGTKKKRIMIEVG